MTKTLDEVRAEVAAVNANAERVCAGLSEDQLSWRPHPGKWSIAENLVHLNLTTQVFLPSLDKALRDGNAKAMTGNPPYELGFFGRIFVWYVEPPPKLKAPAPKLIRPLLQGPATEALPQFLRSQKLALQRIDAAEGLDLNRISFRSPLSAIISMNLISYFAVMTGHQRRHLHQAEQVRNQFSR